MKRWISSADLRLFAKQSVRRPRSTSCAISRRRLAERARAQAELLVEQRRVPERDRPLRARRGVVLDHGRRRARAASGASCARVRDRRRGEQELRVGAVDRARSGAAAGGRCRRASRRRRGRRAPRRRPRRRGSRARRPSGRGAAGRRRGACRGSTGRGSTTCGSASGARPRCRRRRSPARTRGTFSAVSERELILGERLRRVEVERALLRLARERVEHGQVEGERLPARGAGDDRDVLARARPPPRPRPGARRARATPRASSAARTFGCELVRERRGSRLSRGLRGRGGRAPRRRGSPPTRLSRPPSVERSAGVFARLRPVGESAHNRHTRHREFWLNSTDRLKPVPMFKPLVA